VRQQINLYQPIFSEDRNAFSATRVAFVMLAIVAGLAAFSTNASLRVKKLAADVEVLRAQQAEQEALLGAEKDSPEAIEARVKRLDRLVAERGRALEILKSGAAGTTVGFAPRLEALARRHVDGLWIDSMHLSGTNGAMMLSGATFNPDMVPAYLRSLAQDKTLAGTRFDDFIIERPIVEVAAAEGEDRKPAKPLNPKLVRFRAGSSSLKTAQTQEAST
jgi:cell division protein FtsB